MPFFYSQHLKDPKQTPPPKYSKFRSPTSSPTHHDKLSSPSRLIWHTNTGASRQQQRHPLSSHSSHSSPFKSIFGQAYLHHRTATAPKVVHFSTVEVQPYNFDWKYANEVWYTREELKGMNEVRFDDAAYLRKRMGLDGSGVNQRGGGGSGGGAAKGSVDELDLIGKKSSSQSINSLLTHALSDPDIYAEEEAACVNTMGDDNRKSITDSGYDSDRSSAGKESSGTENSNSSNLLLHSNTLTSLKHEPVSIRGIEHFVYPELQQEMIRRKKLVQTEVLDFVKAHKEGKRPDPQGWRLAQHSRNHSQWARDVALEKGMRYSIEREQQVESNNEVTSQIIIDTTTTGTASGADSGYVGDSEGSGTAPITAKVNDSAQRGLEVIEAIESVATLKGGPGCILSPLHIDSVRRPPSCLSTQSSLTQSLVIKESDCQSLEIIDGNVPTIESSTDSISSNNSARSPLQVLRTSVSLDVSPSSSSGFSFGEKGSAGKIKSNNSSNKSSSTITTKSSTATKNSNTSRNSSVSASGSEKSSEKAASDNGSISNKDIKSMNNNDSSSKSARIQPIPPPIPPARLRSNQSSRSPRRSRSGTGSRISRISRRQSESDSPTISKMNNSKYPTQQLREGIPNQCAECRQDE